MSDEHELAESHPKGTVAENPFNVKQSVDAELLAELRDELGFSELRSEKALYFTNNFKEAAIQWLIDHVEDEDIDVPVSSAPKMSTEEADQKALELQRRVRENRAKREKEDALEKERKRVEMGRNMLDTQRQLEEAEKKRMIEQMRREKSQHESERQRQLDLLKEEYEQRFGKPYPEEERQKDDSDISKKSGKDQVAYWIGKLKIRANDENKMAFVLCLKTLETYIKNAHDNPTATKYHRIKKDNKVFVSCVIPFAPETLSLLDAVGFHDTNEGFLAIKDVPDRFVMSQALKFLNLVISQSS